MVTDYAGHELKAGQTVVYPVRRGSAMWLSEITVTKVNGGGEPSIIGSNSEGRRVTVKNLKNVVIITKVPAIVS